MCFVIKITWTYKSFFSIFENYTLLGKIGINSRKLIPTLNIFQIVKWSILFSSIQKRNNVPLKYNWIPFPVWKYVKQPTIMYSIHIYVSDFNVFFCLKHFVNGRNTTPYPYIGIFEFCLFFSRPNGVFNALKFVCFGRIFVYSVLHMYFLSV